MGRRRESAAEVDNAVDVLLAFVNDQFSTGGCRQIVGRLVTSKVVLYLQIYGSRQAIYDDLLRQSDTIRTTIREITASD